MSLREGFKCFNARPNFSSYKKLCLPPSLGKGEVPGRKFTAALVQFYKQTKCQAGIVGGCESVW